MVLKNKGSVMVLGGHGGCYVLDIGSPCIHGFHICGREWNPCGYGGSTHFQPLSREGPEAENKYASFEEGPRKL